MLENNLFEAAEPAEKPVTVLCLAGATGTGKTRLAVELSRYAPCEIINADSRQLYADFPILSAQPGQEELAQTPHHLYGILKSDQKCNSMNWASMAAREANKIASHGHMPVFVGGTGFYFETLLKGLSPMPTIDSEISSGIWEDMNKYGALKMYEKLLLIDPEYATTIHPHDKQRIGRALEVWAASGRKFSWWRNLPPQKPEVNGILLVLDTAINEITPLLLKRIDQMLANGALEEVKVAKNNCPNISSPGWSCIGGRQCLDYLDGKSTLADLRDSWLADTRAYAKRQITWFRARGYAKWLKPEKFLAYALKLIDSQRSPQL